jgi:hypothetical protein
MQADAYAGFNRLYDASRKPAPITEVACWSHARHNFFDLARLAKAPIAIEAVKRIDELFAIEREINGLSPQQRLCVRNERSRPLMVALEVWLREQRAKLSGQSSVSKAIAYCLTRWVALTRFLDDGRLCMSNNAAEREIRPIAVGRHNWTFAGSDEGGRRAAAIYTLIHTCLCRARHKAVYADCRTMPNGFGKNPPFARTCGWSSGRRPSSIRHSLASYSASRKASRRSLGWKRVRLRWSYGLSFARAASLSARWACR